MTLTLYPPVASMTDMLMRANRRTLLKPVIIEFHNTLVSLGTRLWQLVPSQFHYETKRDEKAWESTISLVQELITEELPRYGYTSYRWDEQFDKTFITPMRDGKPLQIKKKNNLEHYEEEKENLENFRADVEQLLIENIPRIYLSLLPTK